MQTDRDYFICCKTFFSANVLQKCCKSNFAKSGKSKKPHKHWVFRLLQAKGNYSSSTTTEESSDPSVDDSKDVSIETQELYNQNGIVITATELNIDGTWGPEVKVLIENNSDKNVTVQTRNSSVNGFMTDIGLSCDVAAGKKANDSLILDRTTIELCSIETITNIEFSFHIFDSETWDDIVNTDMISITTSANGNYDQSYDDSGDVLYDNNGIRIISKGFVEDGIFGPELYLYIENNSGQNITVQARDTSINGFMIEPNMSDDVVSGKVNLGGMTFFESDFELNGITDVETVETAFHIFNTESWEDIDSTSPITINCN